MLTHCPPSGLCLPVVYDHCRDGDTIVVRIPGSAFTWAVRLLDCWCPEKDTTIGLAATTFAKEVLSASDPNDLRLYVPLPTGVNILRSLSFDRIIGVLFVGPTQSLNSMLIQHSLASSVKNGELGL